MLPEVVELAVVGTGLGMLRSGVVLVGKSPTFWDSTQWGVAPRPFLDSPALAYANAIAAWTREETKPEWVADMVAELRRPAQNSLKFLFKTGDSFFQPSQKQQRLGQPPNRWWELAASQSPSSQLIALRHLEAGSRLTDQQESLLLEKLGSSNRAIVLYSIAAVERMAIEQPSVLGDRLVQELRTLSDHRDDEIRAKAMCSITRLDKMDEITVEVASHMLESNVRHVLFAGGYALSTLDSVSDSILTLANRSFVRSLQACDYEFVGLFAAAFHRWLDDPKSHVEQLLVDSPEYLPVALDALEPRPDQLVSIA